MPTRANIAFYKATDSDIAEPHAMIYKHADGYPESEHGVVALILTHLVAFAAKRGTDASYQAAYVLGRMQATNNNFIDGLPRMTGYGICAPKGVHGDIEWFYACYPDRLEVYESNGGFPDNQKPFSIHPYA